MTVFKKKSFRSDVGTVYVVLKYSDFNDLIKMFYKSFAY